MLRILDSFRTLKGCLIGVLIGARVAIVLNGGRLGLDLLVQPRVGDICSIGIGIICFQ